jgi:ABC-type transporter Mla subunit MlaD
MIMSKELKIGTFVVTIAVASFFLINYLRGEDLFNREIELTSRVETVEGLVASAPVYIKGYKAGKVSEIICIYHGRKPWTV